MRESVWVRLLEKLDKKIGAKFLSKEIYCLLNQRSIDRKTAIDIWINR